MFIWLAQVISGGEAVKKLTDETWAQPLGWWSVAIIMGLAIPLGILVWRLILRSDKADAALSSASDDRVKLASSSSSMIEQVKSEMQQLRAEIQNLTRTIDKIWEWILRKGGGRQ